MANPTLVIEVSPAGVHRVLVSFDQGDRSGGFRLVERITAALGALDAAIVEDRPGASAKAN
jgi:hypothetical protein